MMKCKSAYCAGDVICTFDKSDAFVEGRQLIIKQENNSSDNNITITHNDNYHVDEVNNKQSDNINSNLANNILSNNNNSIECEIGNSEFNVMVINGAVVAIRDIHVDEELCCNFNLFIYDKNDYSADIRHSTNSEYENTSNNNTSIEKNNNDNEKRDEIYSSKLHDQSNYSECCVLVYKPHHSICGFACLSDDERQRLYRFADEYVRERAIEDGFVPNGHESGIIVRPYTTQDYGILHTKHKRYDHDVSSANDEMTLSGKHNSNNNNNNNNDDGNCYSLNHYVTSNNCVMCDDHYPSCAPPPNPRPRPRRCHLHRCERLVAAAATDHCAGAVVVDTAGVLLPFPLQSTIAVPTGRHLRLTGGAEFIRHSCLPNLRLELDANRIRGIALRPIEAGEVLTYNYLCTEWEMATVFHCSCNVYCCYGVIKGFRYLDREQQQHLLPHCSLAVKERYLSSVYTQPQHCEQQQQQQQQQQQEEEEHTLETTLNLLTYCKYDAVNNCTNNDERVVGTNTVTNEDNNSKIHTTQHEQCVLTARLDLPAGTVLYYSDKEPVEINPTQIQSIQASAKSLRTSHSTSSSSSSSSSSSFTHAHCKRLFVNFNGAVKLSKKSAKDVNNNFTNNNNNVVNKDEDEDEDEDELVIYHSCHPTAAILDRKLVLCCDVTAFAPVTVNMNELFYRLEYPFLCDGHCRSYHTCNNLEAHEASSISCECNGSIKGFAALPEHSKDAIILCTSPHVRAMAVADGYQNKSSSSLVQIKELGGCGQATFATQHISSGSTFFHVTGLVLPFPTVYTIMLTPEYHLLFADGAQCLAHSCEPNVQICLDTTHNTLHCKALRDIATDELIAFDYNTTE